MSKLPSTTWWALRSWPKIRQRLNTMANLPAQKIGPNDLIAISVYDAPEFTRTIRVSDDGMIRLPMVQRRIEAKGLLPSELEASIASVLQAEQILVDPVVTITIVEYHSRPISVVGAVRRPLTFQADTAVSLLDAIARAEGLTAGSGVRRFSSAVLRRGRTAIRYPWSSAFRLKSCSWFGPGVERHAPGRRRGSRPRCGQSVRCRQRQETWRVSG